MGEDEEEDKDKEESKQEKEKSRKTKRKIVMMKRTIKMTPKWIKTQRMITVTLKWRKISLGVGLDRRNVPGQGSGHDHGGSRDQGHEKGQGPVNVLAPPEECVLGHDVGQFPGHAVGHQLPAVAVLPPAGAHCLVVAVTDPVIGEGFWPDWTEVDPVVEDPDLEDGTRRDPAPGSVREIHPAPTLQIPPMKDQRIKRRRKTRNEMTPRATRNLPRKPRKIKRSPRRKRKNLSRSLTTRGKIRRTKRMESGKQWKSWGIRKTKKKKKPLHWNPKKRRKRPSTRMKKRS